MMRKMFMVLVVALATMAQAQSLALVLSFGRTASPSATAQVLAHVYLGQHSLQALLSSDDLGRVFENTTNTHLQEQLNTLHAIESQLAQPGLSQNAVQALLEEFSVGLDRLCKSSGIHCAFPSLVLMSTEHPALVVRREQTLVQEATLRGAGGGWKEDCDPNELIARFRQLNYNTIPPRTWTQNTLKFNRAGGRQETVMRTSEVWELKHEKVPGRQCELHVHRDVDMNGRASFVFELKNPHWEAYQKNPRSYDFPPNDSFSPRHQNGKDPLLKRYTQKDCNSMFDGNQHDPCAALLAGYLR